MLELWQHAISPINLPFTIVLGAFGLYWLFVILGILGLDDAHHDDVDADAPEHEPGEAQHPGAFGSLMHFLHVGEVPFMIVASILSLSMWVGSIAINYYFNQAGIVEKALVLFLPVTFVGVVVTHFLALPFKKVYQLLEQDYDLHEPLVGSIGTVVSGEVSQDFGQVMVGAKGAPITLNARTSSDRPLRKGDKALIVEEDKKRRIFKVVRYEQPETEE